MIYLPINYPKLHIPFIYYNYSASIAKGFYLAIPAYKYHDGDYVVYVPPKNVKDIAVKRNWIRDGDNFIKKIGAMPGEHYEIDNSTLKFIVNFNYVGQVFISDRNNQPMPMLRGKFTVPKDEFLPIANNPHSFDGRYTGTVPLKNIKAKTIPLITW